MSSSTLSRVTMFYAVEQALRRPTECFLQSRKYSVARQSTQSRRSKHSVARHDALSSRGITNPGQEWSFFDRSKHTDAHHDALFCRSKYSVVRRDAFSNCGNTLSVVKVLYSAEASTLSVDIMLNPTSVVL